MPGRNRCCSPSFATPPPLLQREHTVATQINTYVNQASEGLKAATGADLISSFACRIQCHIDEIPTIGFVCKYWLKPVSPERELKTKARRKRPYSQPINSRVFATLTGTFSQVSDRDLSQLYLELPGVEHRNVHMQSIPSTTDLPPHSNH